MLLGSCLSPCNRGSLSLTPTEACSFQALLGDLCTRMLGDKEEVRTMRKVFQTATHVLQGVSGQSWLPIHKVTLQHGASAKARGAGGSWGLVSRARHQSEQSIVCVLSFALLRVQVFVEMKNL